MKRASTQVHLYIGTRKGGFIFSSDPKRKDWKLEGPFHKGWEVNHLDRDPRDGRLWAAINTTWWGNDVQVSPDGGKTWEKSSAGIAFDKDRGLNLNRIWRIQPDRASRPNTLWCGVDPGALFRSDDGGKNWSEVRSLTDHPSRAKWSPGGGGMMVHHIIPDPFDEKRIGVGISAAGFFRSDDDGATWHPYNRGVLADFNPEKYPVVGQCVHSMHAGRNPGWIFQQNHCGVYRTKDAGEHWIDCNKGLPSRFAFAIAVDPNEKETIYVFPEISPAERYMCDGRLGVYRSRNGGKKWELLKRGLPQKNVYTQVLRHSSATDTCERAGVYFGTTAGEVYYSVNGGDAWTRLASNLPPVICVEAQVVHR
jgi:photosystem II stability/assembly factor-like uncharacterized protein